MSIYKPSMTKCAVVFVLYSMSVLIIEIVPALAAKAEMITASDVAMAKQVIEKNTMSIPGFGVGSRVTVSSGQFSSSDALVLYLLKFHQ